LRQSLDLACAWFRRFRDAARFAEAAFSFGVGAGIIELWRLRECGVNPLGRNAGLKRDQSTGFAGVIGPMLRSPWVRIPYRH
jgi:hypothetical protein